MVRRVVLLDGATGTELTRRGVPTPLPVWSTAALLDHPERVEGIHRDYAEAGADIVVANTFRANPRVLRDAGLLEEGAALIRRAIRLARRGAAHGAGTLVAASVAPVEDCYRPERVPDENTLREEHRQMMTWVESARPDLVWVETMNTVREARQAAAAAHDSRLPFVVSFVVRENGELLSGEPLADAVAAVEPSDPVALGLNCIPPEGMTRNLPRLREATERPLVAYAHIGNPEPIAGWSFSQTVAPDAYAGHAARWIEIGARVVGGCCGTTPAHIAALRSLSSVA